MAEDDVKAFQIRLPLKVYDELSESAKKNLRSLNAEIIIILRKYFQMIADSEAKDELIEVLTHVDAKAVADAIERLKGKTRK